MYNMYNIYIYNLKWSLGPTGTRYIYSADPD